MRWINGLVLMAAGALWASSGTERELAVLAADGSAGSARSTEIRRLETAVAGAPDDEANVRALAQAYLDARAPGLALALVERSSDATRAGPRVKHVYARALLDEGRAQDALAVERNVLATCMMADGICDTWLVTSARRRADILAELVELGVEDARAHPEASAVAYHNATREARLALR